MFCDWYLELLKPVFMGDDEAAKAESQAVVAFVLDEIYKLLHPIMPFMTEELWAQTAGEGQSALDAALPRGMARSRTSRTPDAAAEINWLIDLVSGIRSVRSEMNVPPAAIAPLVVVGANAETRERLARHEAAIKRLARVGEISHADAAPSGVGADRGRRGDGLPAARQADRSRRRRRRGCRRNSPRSTEEIARLHKKLSNEKFVANAPEEVVAAEREKLDEYREAQAKLDTALSRVRSES